MIRGAAVTVATAALLLAGAAPAAAVPILDEADAQELVAGLAETGQAQGVCYGWDVTVADQETGLAPQQESGSSTGGVGVPLDTGSCERYAYLEGSVVYTSASSDLEDSASIRVLSEPPLSGADLGVSPNDLLGEADDLALAEAIGRLPLLMVQAGHAEPVPAVASTDPLPEGETLSPDPGGDGLRQGGPGLLIGAVLTLGGGGWLVAELLARRRKLSSERNLHVR